jgi:two-component system cell cycle response regulator
MMNTIQNTLTASKQIMLVDDEMAMLTLVSITMKRHGFRVIEAENAAKALSLLEKSVPDLIIIDMMMPGMDGIELCERIRARPQTSHIPVIMLSALHDGKNAKRALEVGANLYLPKVTSHYELITKVRDILTQHPPAQACG